MSHALPAGAVMGSGVDGAGDSKPQNSCRGKRGLQETLSIRRGKGKHWNKESKIREWMCGGEYPPHLARLDICQIRKASDWVVGARCFEAWLGKAIHSTWLTWSTRVRVRE